MELVFLQNTFAEVKIKVFWAPEVRRVEGEERNLEMDLEGSAASYLFVLSPNPEEGQWEKGFVFASLLGPGKISKV